MAAPPFNPGQPPQQGPIVREGSTYMTDPQAEAFCRVFAETLRSGISYQRVMDFLERKGISKSVTNRLRYALIDEGLMLGEAFAKYGILDPAARKLILVAEEQGNMPEAFRTQMPFYRARYERKKEILANLAEPMFVGFISAGMFAPLISNIFAIYSSKEGVFSAAFKYMLGPMTAAAFTLLLVIVGAVAWLNTPVDFSMREAVANLWMRIPIVSKPARLNSVALFCRFMSASIRSGMNIYDVIYLAAEACNDPRLLDDIDDVLAAIEDGVSLGASISLFKALPEEAVDYIALGEETGRLEELILQCAEVYEERAKDAFEKMMSMITFMSRLIFIFGVLAFALIFGSTKLMGDFADAMG